MSGIVIASSYGQSDRLKEAIFNFSFAIQEWQVPAGVTSFSAVGVGGGGGGVYGFQGSGGGGGALAWVNDVPCTPGEIIKVFAGHGGNQTTVANFGVMGNPSLIYRQTPGYHDFEHVQLAIRASLGYDASMDRKRVTLVAGSPSVSIVTNQSKFNGSSYYFPANTTGYLLVHNARRFNQTANDFTISMWVKHQTVGTVGQVYIVRQVNASNCNFRLASAASGSLVFRYQNGLLMSTPAGLVTADGNWHHMAVTRSGGTLRMFYDGVQVASASISGAMNFTTEIPIIIGQDQQYTTIGGAPFRGWMDDIVLVNGTALWTSNFTPPTAPIETGTAFLAAGGGGAIGNSGGNLFGIWRYGDGGANGGSGGTRLGNYAMGGGGGAGGYSGTGGTGATLPSASGFQTANGANGTGGAGGGGGVLGRIDTCYFAPGGGVGIYGEGASGAGGLAGDLNAPESNYEWAQGGRGGSGGTTGGDSGAQTLSPVSGSYGGGGGGYTYVGGSTGFGGAGGAGVVRIVWGKRRTFPNNAY